MPRWARLAAYAIPFTVLPSSLWRIAACTFHAPILDLNTHVSSGIPGLSLELFVVLLSLASEVAAFTAVGLIARWGEVIPGWVPVLGGRPVPGGSVVVAGTLGAALLTLLSLWVAVHLALGQRIDGSVASAPMHLFGFHNWQGVLAVVTYAPLLLWGPLLAAVTVSYHRRRR